MRVHVYSQELTSETDLVRKEGTDKEGQPETFYGVRLFLKSPEELHHTPEDDDRSAVTLWLPKSPHRRAMLAKALREMADHVQSTYEDAQH
jgi:hypothetical protein